MIKKSLGVVIGASSDSVHTIQKAKEQGVYVVALDGNSHAEGFRYADESVTVDISDVEAVCRVIERIKPDFILPVPIGRYLTTTGYINEKYNKKGVRYYATQYSTDKYIFHQKMQKSGLRNVQCYLVNNGTDISRFLIDYPAIMKPRFGSGSRDVFFIENEDELSRAYSEIRDKDEDFVLEQAVCGNEYGVDGVVIDGKLYVTLIRKKIITAFPVRQAVSYLSVEKQKNREFYEAVENCLHHTIEVLEYDNCMLNADLMMDEKGELFVIEISPRPGGHNINDVFAPLATSIDLEEEYIKFLLGKEYCFESDDVKCMQIRYFDFEDVIVKKIPSVEKIREKDGVHLVAWECNIQPGDYMQKVTDGHSIMGRGYFIVEGKDEKDLLAQSKLILSMFECEK